MPTQIPFLLLEKFNTSGSFAGVIISVAFFCNALGAIAFSKLKPKFSYATIYISSLGLIALGFTIVGLINNVFFFFITSPILGFSGGVMMTNVTAWMLSKTTFKKRVKSSGYFTSCLFLGQFSSPIIFHPLINIFEIQDFFLVIGLGLFIITIIAVISKKFILK